MCASQAIDGVFQMPAVAILEHQYVVPCSIKRSCIGRTSPDASGYSGQVRELALNWPIATGLLDVKRDSRPHCGREADTEDVCTFDSRRAYAPDVFDEGRDILEKRFV